MSLNYQPVIYLVLLTGKNPHLIACNYLMPNCSMVCLLSCVEITSILSCIWRDNFYTNISMCIMVEHCVCECYMVASLDIRLARHMPRSTRQPYLIDCETTWLLNNSKKHNIPSHFSLSLSLSLSYSLACLASIYFTQM